MTNYAFDWSEMAFASKKPLSKLDATFIVAPREISLLRFKQLIKQYLPTGNIILGLAKEAYILGFDGQAQFKTLQQLVIQEVVDTVNTASSHKIYTLTYAQRDLDYILQQLAMQRAILVNGSWHLAFHNLPAYYTLVNRQIAYDMVSPFVDEAEATAFVETHKLEVAVSLPGINLTEQQLLVLAANAAKQSYDYTFQTGAALAKKQGTKYKVLAVSHNKVVPFETYAMHHGAVRETYFSPPHDLAYYDTVHAEMMLLIQAQKHAVELQGTTLFINLLPCPTCARNLSQTEIAEIVYTEDHSDGYAVKMLEAAGKKVRRLVY